MTGQAHLFVLLPFAVVAAGLALWWWKERRAARSVHNEVRSFRCPVLRRRVVATLVRDSRSDEVVGVVRCDAFRDPETVVCPKECVELFNRSGKHAKAQPANASSTP